jgi:PAS domain S-box-containing protein
MTAAAPLISADGQLLAVLAGRLKLEEMNTIVNRRTGLYDTEDALLVNTSRLFVTQPRFVTGAAVLERSASTMPIELCLNGGSGAVLAEDYRGVPVLASYHWLPERELCLIVKVDQSEAFALARELGTTIVMTGGLTLLAAAILATALARTLTRPILALQQGVARFSRGELDASLPDTTGDELGQLSHEFNQMARSLAEKDARLSAQAADLERTVTERTQALRQSEAHYRSLFENMLNGFAYCQMLFEHGKPQDFIYLDVNPAFGELTGLMDVIGKRVSELIPGILESNPEVIEIYGRVALTGDPESFETFVEPLGIWFSVTVYSPAREFFVAVFDTITERKRAEERLRQVSDRLMLAARAANVGIWDLDIVTGALVWDDAMFRLYGIELEHFTGSYNDWRDSVHPDDQARVEDEYHEALQGQKEYDTEFRVVRSDGSVRHIKAVGLVQRDEMGNPRRMLGTNWDISESKQAQESLLRYAEDLRRSNAELEQFAYVASHDLQEPLRMVTSYLQLIERRYKGRLDADADDFIGFAVDGAERMKGLINDLLAYSRVGTRGGDFRPVDCNAVLDRVKQYLGLAIEENHATITSAHLPTILADEAQLVQLFQNLIGNAIKFHSDRPPHIHIDVQMDAAEVLFSVRDNGIGIDPQFDQRIFVIFQRLHRKNEYGGTGIGLAICKKIVERHGGRIWVESLPGAGATFYFTINQSALLPWSAASNRHLANDRIGAKL